MSVKQLNLDDKHYDLLVALADEVNLSPSALAVKLIDELDSNRHIVWDRISRQHLRIKCGAAMCQETIPYDSNRHMQ